jgi:tetratricopeptide (TPR) repeat protein
MHSSTLSRALARQKVWLIALAVLLSFAWQPRLSAQVEKARTAGDYQKQALADYRAKNYAASLENFKQAAALVPNYPRYIYNIAALQTLLGRHSEAIKSLHQLADMGLVYDVEKPQEFAPLKGLEEFKALLQKFADNQKPVVKSEPAFTIDEKGLVTESVAYDPTAQTFYVSSVHKRKIISRDRQGRTKDFAGAADGLWSVLGMKVDAKRRHLWVASSAYPQMVDYKKEEEGFAGVFKFDLKTGRLIKKYILPKTTANHGFGDLLVSTSGDVYISDSMAPAIYFIGAQKDDLELFLENENFVSLQGLAFAADEKQLFVADYARGIFAIELKTRNLNWLAPPANVTLHGIDGLYFYKGSLIAIQNGVNPHRLIRLWLSADQKQCRNATVIEANNPLFDEPTLGVIIRDTFYFIANSQWEKVDEKGQLAPADKLQHPLVLKVKL